MDQKKQITPIGDDAVSPAKFWGTLAMGAIAVPIVVYFLIVSIQSPRAIINDISIGLYGLIMAGTVASIVLTIRGRQDLGARFTFYVIQLFGLVIVSTSQERALTASFSLLGSSIIAILGLFPKKSRFRYFGIAGTSFLLIWLIEWINPPWRTPSTAAAIGPITAIAFTIILISIVAAQVWRAGNTLRNKMIVAFLAITIIPLLVVGYITYISTSTALTDAANQKLAAAARQVAVEIDEFMNFNLETVRTAGKYPEVVDYMALPARQRAGSPEEVRLGKLLVAISRQDPVFISSVAVFDMQGNTVADTYAADIGLNKSDRTYFNETIKTGLPYASDVEFSSTTGVASIYFSAPVREADGNMIGVLRIRYFASILQKSMTAHTGDVGETSYTVLLDENHVRLAHGTNRNRLFKSLVPLEPERLKDLQAKGLMPPGTPEELATDFTEFEAGLNNIDQVPYFASDTTGDGTLDQSAFAKMTTKPWVVTFIQNQSVLLEPVTRQTNTIVLVAIFIATLTGAVGFFFSQSLAGPIARLTHTAEAIASGDINIQAKVETRDEIGALATTFNRMTQQLRDFITNLEARVEARTKDLATVAEVGNITATILETNRLLQTVVDLTKQRFNLYHSHIYLLDETSENLVLTAGAGEVGRIMSAEKRTIPLNREQSLVARAARENKGVTVNDVTLAPDFLPNPLLPNTRSELAVPMTIGSVVIGVFDIQSDQVGRFTEADVSIQTTLASQIATSIQNARLFESSQNQAELEGIINSIGQKIQRATTMEDTLQIAVRELGMALGAKRVSARLGLAAASETSPEPEAAPVSES